MAFIGQDIIDTGMTKVGQKYVFGARVPLNNPNWRGPWDCAEFASWCAYQAYGLIFGAGGTTKPAKAEPYSGYWYSDARKYGRVIPWRDALKIPGAALIRSPAPGKIGHVAFAIGDNDRTLEARGTAFGVGVFKSAGGRAWSMGCLLPGVDYDTDIMPAQDILPKPAPLTDGFLWLRVPNIKGADIVALQKALRAKGVDPGPIDGKYGPMTDAAVVSFQVMKGLEVDGVVGPATAKALGLPFPIPRTDENAAVFNEVSSPKGPSVVKLPPAATGFDSIVSIKQSGRIFTATTISGESFIVGASTTFTDDMTRTGLFQGAKAIKDSLRFGVYKAQDFFVTFDQWAYFIEPTLSAEGGARFATLNTYDRAAFTFGAPQLAAHTPEQNFIVYLRLLLALPGADSHFPELSLRKSVAGDTTIHLSKDSGFIDLEEVVLVTRPNGKKEKQLAKLMVYLNASPTAVDNAELLAAARLMNWLRLDPKTKELQINVFITQAQKNLERAKVKVDGFDGTNWQVALWIMDIMHQGRGTFSEMSAALTSSSPLAGLKRIGQPTYKTRIETIAKAIAKLESIGVMNGFIV